MLISRNQRTIYSLLITLCFTECSTQSLPKTKQDLLTYTNNPSNGLAKSIKQDNYIITATYQPPGLAPKCPACRDYWYFTFKITGISSAEGNSFPDAHVFPESIETFAFRMGDYVKLVTPNDTITAADYTFQRTFGLDRQGTFLFVFPKKLPQVTSKFSLLMKANGLIHEPIILDFKTQDIEKTQVFPAL